MHNRYYLIAALYVMLGAFACRQGNVPSAQAAMADSVKIEKLIARARNFQTGTSATLPKIAAGIDSLSAIHGNRYGMIYADIFRAHYCWLSSKYQDGMRHALNALAHARQWNIPKPIPEIYSIMANMHKENGNYTQAQTDCVSGLNVARANKDTSYIISLLGLRAMFIHGHYNRTGTQKNDTISLPLQFEALAIAESQPKYETMRIRFYDNIAQTYNERGEYDKAIVYADSAVVLANKYHQLRSLTYADNWLGEAYYYKGQRDTGIAYLNRAIAISRKIDQPYREMEIYDAMYLCYMHDKNYEPAIRCLHRSYDLRDSLQIAQNEDKISEMEMQLKYDSHGKDTKIALLTELDRLKNQKILRITVAMICFLILMGIIAHQYVIISRSRKLIEANNQELNKALLKIAHIQSHQIRKPLASIMGLMNVIKTNNYEPDRETLQKMDTVAQELDEQIRNVIRATEVND